MRAIQKVAVIGAGTMGQGIAQVAASAGHEVVVFDINNASVKNAEAKHQALVARMVEKGKWTTETATAIFGKISYSNTLSDCKDSDLVIEAIVENLDVKQAVFADIEHLVSDTTILATNTSSLSVTAIANGCKNPSRVVGLHFFNPAPLMKLVELVPAVQTDPTVIHDAYKLMQQWGKTCVKAKDTPGFIVNRVARPFYGEAIRIYEEGIADPETIDTIMRQGGYRMGPFQLTDYIGHDVNYKVTSSVWEAFYYDERYKPSFTQKSLVDAGYLGKKSGKGFYTYPHTVVDVDYDKSLIEKVLYRINLMLINEAADAVFWNVATPTDIELAMTKGVNYPKGLLELANTVGIQTCVDMVDALYDRYRESRYRCSPILRDMAAQGQLFNL